jgi:ParB-like chromosome segregation protein Spo0J
VPMQDRYQVMPDLSPEEEAALTSDIATYGVKNPIHVDEADNTLDGFHRRRISTELGRECPTEVIPGLTEAQKREHAWRMNLMRRHLTREQKYEIARTLRQEGWTQERIAQALGLSQATVSRRLEQSIQMDKLPQAETIRGKDGRAYPPA